MAKKVKVMKPAEIKKVLAVASKILSNKARGMVVIIERKEDRKSIRLVGPCAIKQMAPDEVLVILKKLAISSLK